VNADYFRLLFSYNLWANERVFERAGKVREEDYFAAVPGLSFDTLHATLAHMIVADAVWLGRWTRRELSGPMSNARDMAPIIERELRTYEDVVERWRMIEAQRFDFLAWLSDEEVAKPLVYRTVDGTEYAHPLGQQMAHVLNHGTQFRSEAAVALTKHGFSPGDLDLALYLREQT
jgi:uncharacterized damage-inducible protein DinB